MRPEPSTGATETVEIFFSYSHKDEALRERLENHLAILRRQGIISGWHDRMIGPGQEWKGEIDRRLDSARIILLLISPSFLASDYCYDVEMMRAIQRHDRGEATVIPVILRPCDWHGAPFGKLQGLPRDAKPVTSWRDRDEAFKNVAEGIREAVARNAGASPKSFPPHGFSGVGYSKVAPPTDSPRKIKAQLSAHLIETSQVDYHGGTLRVRLTLALANTDAQPLYVVSARLADATGRDFLSFEEACSEEEAIPPGARRTVTQDLEDCVNNPFFIALFQKVCRPDSVFEVATAVGERFTFPAGEVCDPRFLAWPEYLKVGTVSTGGTASAGNENLSGDQTPGRGAPVFEPFPELKALGVSRLQEVCNEWLGTQEAKTHKVAYLAVTEGEAGFELDFGIRIGPNTRTGDAVHFPLDGLLFYVIDKVARDADKVALKVRVRYLRSKAGPNVYQRYISNPPPLLRLFLKCKNVHCRHLMQTQYRVFQGQEFGGTFEPLTCPRCHATFDVGPGDFFPL